MFSVGKYGFAELYFCFTHMCVYIFVSQCIMVSSVLLIEGCFQKCDSHQKVITVWMFCEGTSVFPDEQSGCHIVGAQWMSTSKRIDAYPSEPTLQAPLLLPSSTSASQPGLISLSGVQLVCVFLAWTLASSGIWLVQREWSRHTYLKHVH